MFNSVNFNFNNKNVLIVGGSRGIGKSLVEEFSNFGATVYYISRKAISSDVDAKHISVDLNNIDEVEKACQYLADERIDIDILINSAAINYAKKINDISIKEWNEVLNVNLNSIFVICKNISRAMVNNGKGKIINVSSIAARHRSPVSGVHYVSSKSALIGFSKQLAFELANDGINVNVVCPSQTKTDMLMSTMNNDQIKELSKTIPLNRLAEVKDQVGPILFLSSELSDYITGAVIDVNGGQI